MKRLLDFNPLTGEACFFIDNNDGTFSLRHEQDVSPIIENNKKLQNEVDRSRKGIKKGMWHYASIPNILVQKWSEEVGGNILDRKYTKELFQRLNSSDYAYLRTGHGKHEGKAR